MKNSDESRETLDHVIARYLTYLEAGEEVDREQLVADYPEFAEGLRQFFIDFDLMRAELSQASVSESMRLSKVTVALQPSTEEKLAELLRKLHATPKAKLTLVDTPPTYSSKPSRSQVIDGKYKLLQRIGRGGMGDVWMAEQMLPVQRRVALKLIRSGMDLQKVVRRFEAERQALALMEHPCIAKIFDAGTTEDSQPYFVMELVQGVPINAYCDQNHLSIEERLRLFNLVCDAVQHAHQKGIVHRDLKPTNILVTQYDGLATPKVIDFGLAKALEHQLQLTDKTLFTEFGQVVGTLQYMSPEQAEMNALDIDTRTDVYSLGVILFELLTGTTPLDRDTLKRKAIYNVLELIRNEDAPLASHRLSSIGDEATAISEQRRTDVRHLTQTLKGDLDWIVGKALARERNRRYATATDFGTDIQNFLGGLPVKARPPSKAYVFTKFVRRHRGLVGSVSAITIAVLAGLFTSIYFALAEAHSRAEAELKSERLERTVSLMESVFDDIDPGTDTASDESLRSRMAKSLKNAADELAESISQGTSDTAADVRLLTKIAAAMDGLGLETHEYLAKVRPLLDDDVEAEKQIRLQIDAKIAGDNGVDSMEAAVREFANFYGENDIRTLEVAASFAYMLSQANQIQEAATLYEKLISRVESIPEAAGLRDRMLHDASYAFTAIGRPEKGIELLEKSIEGLRTRLGPTHIQVLQASTTLGSSLRSFQPRQQEARPILEEACELLVENHGRWHRRTCVAIMELMIICALRIDEDNNRARLEELLPEVEQSYHYLRKSLGDNHPESLAMFGNLASGYGIAGDLDKCLAMHIERHSRYAQEYGEEHDMTKESLYGLGIAYGQAGDTGKAIQVLDSYLAFAREKYGEKDDRYTQTQSDITNLKLQD